MGTGHSTRRVSFDASGEVNFDHFQILRAIGKGSFGKVCIVQKKDTKRMFAMKYMNKAMCARQTAINNVVRELNLLTRLEHPYIVNLWYAFQDEEDMFMVVDLLLGGDLRYHMQQDVTFSEECVRFYLCELASAIDYLHSQRVIHRDIKPDNILLDEKGHCHVTDFNIATQLGKDEMATSMSGTRPYMAPELYAVALSERRGYSFPVDWWSLGVSLFELLKKRRPFNVHTNTSIQDSLTMMAETKGQPLSVHHVSEEMKEVLRALLEFDPETRLQSVAQLKHYRLCGNISFESVYYKKLVPPFIPSDEHLNCDPTYELEEMIIETKPLHKKKKRLAKQNSRQSQEGEKEDELTKLTKMFQYYNREDSSKSKNASTAPSIEPSDQDPQQQQQQEEEQDESTAVIPFVRTNSPSTIKSSPSVKTKFTSQTLPSTDGSDKNVLGDKDKDCNRSHSYDERQMLLDGPKVTLPRVDEGHRQKCPTNHSTTSNSTGEPQGPLNQRQLTDHNLEGTDIS